MCQRKITVAAAFLTGFLPVMTPFAAMCQDDPAKSNKTEGKKAGETKAAAKTIDVVVQVKGNGDLPANTKVEISGQEKACGDLNSEDATAKIDKNGQALFKGLPVCKVRIKVNAQLYLPVTTPADLSQYKSPISITLEREQ